MTAIILMAVLLVVLFVMLIQTERALTRAIKLAQEANKGWEEANEMNKRLLANYR